MECNVMKGKAVTKCSESCKLQVSDNKRRNLYYWEEEVLRSNEMILFSFNRTLLLSINKNRPLTKASHSIHSSGWKCEGRIPDRRREEVIPCNFRFTILFRPLITPVSNHPV